MNVLTKLHQYEPVSKGEFLHDVLDVVYTAGLGSTTEDENTRCPGFKKLSTLVDDNPDNVVP